MKPTINQMAKMAKVAKSTVSKALNGHKGVSEEKRQRILELADQLRYEPSAMAQALASNRTGTIGLLLPHQAGYALSGFYWSAIITAIADEAGRQNYSLMILSPSEQHGAASAIETVLRRRSVDGLIIGAEHIDPLVIQRVEEEGLPFVFIGRPEGSPYCSVDVDNFGGSEQLVSYLANNGCKKIACLAGPEQYIYNRERIAGYRSALKKCSISWESVKHTSFTGKETRSALGLLLQENPDIDGLFITAGGDFLLDCVDVLRMTGTKLHRPGFGAFDDYRFFDYLDMSVCTIRQPLNAIGSTAATLLFDTISGNLLTPAQTVLDVELILR